MIECNSGNIFRSQSGAVVIAPGPGTKKKNHSVFSGDQTETNTVLNWVAEFLLSNRCCCDGSSLYTAVTHVWRSGPFACNSKKASLYTGCAVGLLWTHLRFGLETASTDAVRDVWSGVVMEINIKEKRTFSVDTRYIWKNCWFKTQSKYNIKIFVQTPSDLSCTRVYCWVWVNCSPSITVFFNHCV